MRSSVVLLVALCALGCGGVHLQVRMPWEVRIPRSMRCRLGGAAVRASEEGEGSNLGGGGGSSSSSSSSGMSGAIGKFFGTNRDTPEAQANQREWARQQMNAEVPETTLEGKPLSDRDDLVAQYIVSEREKFGRELDQATAENEVDEWLLKQATLAPAKTTTTDLALAVGVFIAAFGSGLYFANLSS
jgi:hypothetical protein